MKNKENPEEPKIPVRDRLKEELLDIDIRENVLDQMIWIVEKMTPKMTDKERIHEFEAFGVELRKLLKTKCFDEIKSTLTIQCQDRHLLSNEL